MTEKVSRELCRTIIGKLDVFKGLPSDVIEDLASKLVISDFNAGDIIINKGDQGSTMFLILEGKVKIHDEDTVLAEMGEENFFGEFSLLDDEPRSMSVSAVNNSILGSITQNDFYNLLNEHPHTTRDVIKALIGRLRNQNSRIIEQMRARAEELEAQVQERTQDLKQKNIELSETLSKLKKTQEQLVMQEKLATLGQLTAGIAHEIKNPLNFVNNFSALSNDLIEEFNEAENDEERNEIIEALKDNLARIHQHGKRADSIVASMMMHSRESSGEKIGTNIHNLINESINLAYHGTPTGGQKVNIEFTKEYDESLPEIQIIQQDLNRVLLNIFTNAIHAVRDKAINQGIKDYQPEVKVRTFSKSGNVVINIRDNGTGIPELVKQKVFNPFFTTKPTGQGTGLGLSISFDIIKAHGGNITLDSVENEFTEFEIFLPESG